jgi:hypothetical protein
LASAHVRWKSARFVPLDVVRAILAGEPLNEDDWTVDGASECLVPAGRPGPFRTGVRWNAAIDRMTGASERHATACIEFRPGAGLWTIAGFRDDAAHARWLDPVKAAFRLLCDTGFGGERSRGWGRSEQPEFIEGSLPEMILPVVEDVGQVQEQMPDAGDSGPVEEPSPVPPIEDPPVEPAPVPEPEAPAGPPPPDPDPPLPSPPAPEPSPVVAAAEPAAPEAAAEAEPQLLLESGPQPLLLTESEPFQEPEPAAEAAVTFDAVAPLPLAAEPEPLQEPEPVVEATVTFDAVAPVPLAPSPRPPAPDSSQAPSPLPSAVWLLSLFSPAPADAVDWRRGNYTVLARGGRVDSPAGCGELKKQLQMVVEGSVLYADGVPNGAAPNVAPEGFAHPVFRAGFALAIPLPEVS